MKNIKLIACDTDGVLLHDTYTPVLRSMAAKFGVEYNREFERTTYSRPDEEGALYCIQKYNIDFNIQDLIAAYFKERDEYLKTHESGMLEGAPEFIELLSSFGVPMVCYGGLEYDRVVDDFKKYMPYFEKYVWTGKMRPGVKEIVKDMYGLEYNQVLYIDDVNTVAEFAKANNVPFIGIPSGVYQREDMIATKVKYMFNSVKEIDKALIEKIDSEAPVGGIWGK